LNFTAGLTLTMTFGTGGIINNAGGGASQLLTGTGRVVSYTVESGDSQLDIANGFRQAINDHILAGDSRIDTTGTSFSVGRFISTYEAAGDATMFFRTTMSMGSAVLQFSVTLPTDGYKAFSATESNFGALRLTSLNDTPIQIDLGSGSAVAEHGLLEMNVGAADYDNIDPSMGTTVLVSGLSVSTQSGAESALTVLDQAIVQVGINRAQLGAIENRLDHTVSNLANVVENTEAAKSRIQDADFAYESAQLARAQILQQAGTAMLAQANAAPQNVLSLLG
jgi:flagellin